MLVLYNSRVSMHTPQDNGLEKRSEVVRQYETVSMF